MKKKILIVFFALFYNLVLYGQSISYRIETESFIFNDCNIYNEIPFSKQGREVHEGTFNYELGDSYYCFSDAELYKSVVKVDEGWLMLDSVKRENFDEDIHSKINGNWISSYYYDVFFDSSKNTLLKYEDFWVTDWRYDGDRWQDTIYPTNFFVHDNYFFIITSDKVKRCYLILKEEQEEDSFRITVYLGKYFITPRYYSKTNFLETIKDPGIYTFNLKIDGDYLSLCDDSGYLLMTFAKTEDFYKDRSRLRAISNNERISKNDILWPRHADGTCDYDGSSSVKQKSFPLTNVAPNKVMTVSENLKLRSAEATTSTVLNVMAAGTKVKVLELGKAENIDGINSNWVKVEIISGKDRDGNIIRSGTTGWCYGGYLE